MAHHGDDPSGSAYIKQEPADGEGIYASTGRERTFAEIFNVREEYGLTVQSTQQARDQDRFPVPQSFLEGAELDAMWESLGFGLDPAQSTTQREHPQTPFPHYYPDELDEHSMSRALAFDPVAEQSTKQSTQESNQQSTQQSTQTYDSISPDLFDYRGDESTSQTPSTDQSDFYPSESETPATDVDEDPVQHAIVQPALAGAQQHLAQQTLPGIQQSTLHSTTSVGTDFDTPMPSIERTGTGEPFAKKGESQEIALAPKRGPNHINTNSSPAQLDPATSQDFATFMQLRNSFPIAAVMAMMAPSNKSQVVSTLAEIADAQGLINTGSGVAQSPMAGIPAEMRSILDNLKHKFNSDKSFLKTVICYVTEQLATNGEAEEKPTEMEKLLAFGLDGLKSLPAAQEQILKERKHYQRILADQEAQLAEYKARDEKIERDIQQMMANSPIPGLGQSGSAFPTPNPSPSGPMFPPVNIGEPQPELNWDGSVKDNRFWICRLMKFDGSGLPCHGLNQEWVRRFSNHEGIATAKWVLRENCMKCGRVNKSNRKWLKDGEARMLRPLMGQSTGPVIQQNGGQFTNPMMQQSMGESMNSMIQQDGEQPMAKVQQRKRKAPPAELPAVKKTVPLPAEHNVGEDLEFEKYLSEALDASYFD